MKWADLSQTTPRDSVGVETTAAGSGMESKRSTRCWTGASWAYGSGLERNNEW